jgi:hypothetical protein
LASSIDPKEHSSTAIAFEEIRIIYQFNEKVQDVGEGWGPLPAFRISAGRIRTESAGSLFFCILIYGIII